MKFSTKLGWWWVLHVFGWMVGIAASLTIGVTLIYSLIGLIGWEWVGLGILGVLVSFILIMLSFPRIHGHGALDG